MTEAESLKTILSRSPAWRGALKIISLLEEAGHEAYIVGGSVRDAWLQQQATDHSFSAEFDFDIATSALPRETIDLFRSTIEVGAAFGVVIVRLYDHQYEVATFRQDLEYEDGRRPSGVRFTGVEEDVKRRDFTINGLLYSTGEDKLLDLVDGCADLAAGLVRAIGDPRERFAEDHLRLIRAVRFAARFHFEIEAATLAAIRELAAQLTTVSAERLRDELIKILQGAHPRYALELLQTAGLLPGVLSPFPEPDLAARRVDKLRERQLARLQTNLCPAAFFIYLNCPLRDRDREPRQVRATLRRYRFPNGEIAAATATASRLFQIRDFDQLRFADRVRLLRDEHFPAARHLAGKLYELPLEEVDAERQRLADRELFPPPLLTGNDLKEAGLIPGPLFKSILHELETRQLEGTLFDRAAALELARQLAAGENGE